VSGRSRRPAPPPAGVEVRKVALAALHRIDRDGAYANLVLGPMLVDSGLEARDRHLVTQLVYGTTRMRRACDALVDGWLLRPVEAEVRNALRLGAYQLAYLRLPAHAAVDTTVEVAPRRARGLVNAVLRRVAGAVAAGTGPAEDASALSYPDWIVECLVADLGRDRALAALAAMNEAAEVDERVDGYVQDRASQLVVDAVDVPTGGVVVDLCAAPGGKATGLAARARFVVAADLNPARAGLVVTNRDRLGVEGLAVVVADGRRAPLRSASAPVVLVDAPCSGLGSLRRRPDARWRIEADAPERLASLQRDLVREALRVVAPGGLVVYSVCTLTATETIAIDRWAAAEHPAFQALDAPGEPWQPLGRGALLLPQDAGTDGMYVLRLRAPSDGAANAGPKGRMEEESR